MMQKKTDEELEGEMIDARLEISTLRGQGPNRWMHIKTGKVYRIIDVGFEEATLNLVVIYEAELPHFLVKFTRPFREFLEKFTPIN